MGYWPFLFHLEDYFPQPATVLVEIRDGHVLFADDIRIPVRPVIGTIGVAPAIEAILSGSMGRHCGNVDVQEIAAGSTLYLPVFVEGALLCLGDCHAIQSDGEIGSVEMRSEVTLRCDVIEGRSPNMLWPRVETEDALVTIGIATPLEEAARQALREMICWMEELTGMSKHEAYLLAGCVGAWRPGQAQVPNRKLLHFKGARAVPDFIDPRACPVQNCQQQIRHRRVQRVRQMASGLELPTEFRGHQARQIGVPVQVAVTHAAAVQNEALVEQGTVPVLRGL